MIVLYGIAVGVLVGLALFAVLVLWAVDDYDWEPVASREEEQAR